MLVVVASCDVALREGAAGAGLEVALETQRPFLCREFDRDGQPPRTMSHGISAGSGVVPGQTSDRIAGDPDVVTRWVRLATQDVDETPFSAIHAISDRSRCATSEARRSSSDFQSRVSEVRCFDDLKSPRGEQIRSTSPPSLAIASYGATASAYRKVRLR